MNRRFDVIVAGAGAMGSAACYHLAKRGKRVLGLEKYDIPHGRGSSHGYSRMIRLSYFEHPDYVPLLRQSFLLWDQLEAEANQTIIHLTSGLYMGAPDSELLAGSIRAAREYELPHEMLSRGDLDKRFPQFNLPSDYIGLHDQYAGFVLPERAISTHCELAMRRGAELHGQEPVVRWEAKSSGVIVQTTRDTYEADHLVFCSGAWTNKIVGDLGVPLVVTRQVLGWVWPKRPERFALGTLPVWMVDEPGGNNHYGFPMCSDNPGFKLAQHKRNAPNDPDTLCRDPQPGDEETFRPFLKRFIPDADGPLLSLRVCMYTNTPDLNFIVDRHPDHANVTIACGFSGHGFKFASAMGQVLADLSTNGKPSLPIGFLGLSRFKQGKADAPARA